MPSSNSKTSGLDFLKSVSRNIGNGTLSYISESMPTTGSAIRDAKSTISEISSKLKTTSSDIMPRVRQLKTQAGMRNLMNWFIEKEDQYYDDFGGNLGEWDDDTSAADIAESQISEAKSNANQISGAITESIHKSIESNVNMTANISARIDAQSAVISAGFDRVTGLLNNILNVVTKNTSAIIESQSGLNEQQNVSGMLANGKFNLADYKKIIKDNFKGSNAGAGLAMTSMLFQTMFAGGKPPSAKDLISLGISAGMDKFAPNVGKNLKALDSAISDVIMESLIRLGNDKGKGGLRGTLAGIFGIDSSRKTISTERSELSLKATPFDTVARESIVSAIPGYLRKILVAVGGPDTVYDFRSRSFKTQKQIETQFRQESSKYNKGSLTRASGGVKRAMGNDSWTNMVYDALVNYIGSEQGAYGNANAIIDQLNDPKYVENIIKEQIFGNKMTKMDKSNAKVFARRMASIKDIMEYNSIQMQAAANNTNRNANLPKYVDMMNSLGVDLSYIKDNHKADNAALLREYGRADIASISRSEMDMSSGVNYTNKALYEIFRRLDTGINVYQVGSSNNQKERFKKRGNKYLNKPAKYNPLEVEMTSNTSEQALIGGGGDGGPNLLRNNTDEEGNNENLTKGQRFARWGKSRGKQLGSAIIHGDPAAVREAFMGAYKDVSGVAGDAMKRGIASINSKFGNISGYLGHKMFGSEYSYVDIDPNNPDKKILKTVSKNDNGGLFGFVTNRVKGMLGDLKDKGGKWFSDVAGYFDYGDKDEKDSDVTFKRRKLIYASVGAMAGAGLLGGPVGVIMGAVAGNALGAIPDIGKKLKEKLFGKDKETGKPTGLLNKAADAIITPIQYQFHKTLSFMGDKLKKNIFGPLSDIGYVLKERVTQKVEGTFSKFFGKVLNLGAKALGGIGKLGSKLFGGFMEARGMQFRGKAGAALGVTGFGLKRVSDVLSLGTPGLHDDLKARREEREKSIEDNSQKFEGGLKAYRKNKWAKAANNDPMQELSEYTREQVISTKEVEDSNAQIAKNTNRSVELLESIDNSLRGNSSNSDSEESDASVSGMNSESDAEKRQKEKDAIKDRNSRFGENLVVAETTAAALSGFDNSEIKDIDDTAKAANRGESKDTILGKFKSLMKRNKDAGDKNKDGEEEKESWFSKLTDGLGSIVSKFLPVLLGALLLSNADLRDMLLDSLPGLVKTAIGSAGEITAAVNQGMEASISGAEIVKDPVTGENVNVVSAEQHADDLQRGVLATAADHTFNMPNLVKAGLVSTGTRAGGRLLTSGVQAIASATGFGGGIMSSIGSGLSRAGGKLAGSEMLQALAIDGVRGAGAVRGAGGFFSRIGNGVKAVGQAIKGGSSSVRSGAASIGQGFASFKPGQFFKSLFTPKAIGNLAGGIAADMTAGFSWEAVETAKHANIVGDYGLGNAGGYVSTNTTAKFAVTTTASVAGGFLIGEAIAAAAGSTSIFAVANGWNPVGWAALVVATILVVIAALAALANLIVGWVTDANDRGYAIRTNSSRMKGAIAGSIEYKNGQENPVYAYCGQESDRVIGLTDGLFIKDPEVEFGRYLKTITETVQQSPGSEVLLYDWINNMAVQGVPFAVLVAGDSDEAKADGAQANKNTTGDPPVDRKGPLGGQYTQVKKSTVEKNLDAIYNDIVANISRTDSSLIWSVDNVRDVYRWGKEVADELKSCGVLDGKGKVNTGGFKGKPYSGKNDKNWTALHDICKSKGSYFLTKCLVYINSKIEVDKKTKQQWLEKRQDDLGTFFDGLKDVLMKEYDAEIAQMREEGLSEQEIEDRIRNAVDPKGDKANAAANLAPSEDPYISTIAPGVRMEDQADVHKELKYLSAAYAYSHPSILANWARANKSMSGMDSDDISRISNWDSNSIDSRMKKALRSKMKGAAQAFGEEVGDIFNIMPKFDWSSDGKLYGAGSKKVDKYGSGFVVRGEEVKPSEGILDKVFETDKDYTPDDVHDKLYGRIRHGMGAESDSIDGFDWTMGGNGVLARIANKIHLFGSEEGEALDTGESKDSWRNILFNLPARKPVNLPEGIDDSHVSSSGMVHGGGGMRRPDDTGENAGGPMDANVSQVALNDAGSSAEVEEDQEVEGGNPLNKPYRITSNFGPRKYPHSGMHNGVDLVSTEGGSTQVGSRFEGIVTEVKNNIPDNVRAQKVGGVWKFPYDKSMQTGNMVSIKTSNGMIVKNMHLKAGSIPSDLTPGSKVHIGQRIGTMGSTGWSTGDHLHYEFRDASNNPVDPTDSLSASNSYTNIPDNAETSTGVDYNTYANSSLSSMDAGSESNTISSIFDELKSVGSQFLYKLTGGLIGTNPDDVTSTGIDTSNYYNASSYGAAYGSTYGGASYLTGNSNSNWLRVVRDVKRLVAEQKPAYDQSNWINITYNGKTLKVRTDCTGIICAMLKFYGVMGDDENLNSSGLRRPGAIKKGFDQVDFPGWDRLVEGDILVCNGHAEIFAFNQGSKHYVYNGGNTNALRSAGATPSSMSAYSKIWRCQEEVVPNPNTADPSTIGDSNSDDVYKDLKELGYSDAAAAGVLGTWQKESRNNSKTIEGNYMKGYPGYDQVMSNNASMNNYTQGLLFPFYTRNGMSINQSAYKGTDGNWYPGIGLAQWTGPRHQKLKEYADSRHKDWRDRKTQVEYMDFEKESRGINDSFKDMEDPDSATETFARLFEGTTTSSALAERKANARAFYEKYGNSSENGDAELQDPSAKTDGGTGGPDEGALVYANDSSLGTTSRFSRRPSRRSMPVMGTGSTKVIANNSSNGTRYSMPIQPLESMSNEEVVGLLKDVLVELRAINGNTGNSNTLLKTIGENGIADKDLRNQLSSLKGTGNTSTASRSTGTRSYNPNRQSNARMVGQMVRP